MSPRPGLPMQRPTGFTLLGLYLGWRALEGFLLVVRGGFEALPGRGPSGLSLLTAVFAAVAAEALWRCRPWCVRATIGYYAVSGLAPLVAAAAQHGLTPGDAVFFIIARAVICAIPVLYVNHRAGQIFNPSPARVAVPALRP